MRLTRRELLAAAGGITTGAVLGAPNASQAASGSLLADRAYYLSAVNPIANIDQRDVENTAIRLLARRELQDAREKAGFLWRQVTEHPLHDQMDRFEQMIEECTFNYALKAANADANYPKVLRVYSPPAEWFGRHTPGSRWGGDNPDNAYRIIPIAHGARYELRGQRMPGGAAHVSYTLVANTATSVTLASLEERDVQFERDGSFLISIDDQPSHGRPNHLQTTPTARYLLVRDSLGDWRNETPNALRVQRLTPPDRGALTEEEMARHAATHMLEDTYLLYWFTRLPHGAPVNTLRPPRAAGAVGGLRSQTGSHGVFTLADDEAMIVTANSAGATFRNFVVLDLWFLTLDYWARQSSLNNAQMAPDANGHYTAVVVAPRSRRAQLARYERTARGDLPASLAGSAAEGRRGSAADPHTTGEAAQSGTSSPPGRAPRHSDATLAAARRAQGFLSTSPRRRVRHCSMAMKNDEYFLSDANPIANVDQRELEVTAIRLLQRRELKEGRANAAYLWMQVMEAPAGPQISRFESMMDEYTFNYALKAANSDAGYPKVLRIMQPAAHWFGNDVPGSRWGGDSPDFTYRIIPIAHGGRYEVRGRPTCKTPPTVSYTLVANTATSVTLGALESRDIPTEGNGTFVITIDTTAAAGRPNHIQTQPGAYFLFIRDAIGDWSTQTPNALRVRRLDTPDRGRSVTRRWRNAPRATWWTMSISSTGSVASATGRRRTPCVRLRLQARWAGSFSNGAVRETCGSPTTKLSS